MQDLKKIIKQIVFEVLTESKQNIINLGYPPFFANIFWKKFGKNAFTVAKWYKNYKVYTPANDIKGWFFKAGQSFFKRSVLSLEEMHKLYSAALEHDVEKYNDLRREAELWVDENEPVDLGEAVEAWGEEMENQFLENVFFSFVIIKDIMSGKLKDLTPYKDLPFEEAQIKYDTKNIFSDAKPLKTYENGWRWINVGPKNYLVGQLMKNCGSAGCMSWDEDKTLLVLFDQNQKPHVIVTYSPNEKRISGDESAGGTPVKEEYHEYVLDLAETLGVTFDHDKSKSLSLRIKSQLRGKIQDIKQIASNIFDSYFLIKTTNGKEYYSDGWRLIAKNEIEREGQNFDSLESALSAAFNSHKNPNSPMRGKVKLIDFQDLQISQ